MASDHNIHAQQAGTRRQPPARRRSETRRITWQAPNGTGPETRIFVTIGYAEDGLRPVEIFYNEGYRSGSDLEMLISDICVLLSIMMQHEDVEIGAFSKLLSREQDLRSGDLRFASIIGVLLDELQRPPDWAEAAQGAPDSDARLNGKAQNTRPRAEDG